MIKNLKLNIKNTQLAEALQKQTSPAPEVKKNQPHSAKPVADTPSDDEQRPRAQIIRKAKTKEETSESESSVASAPKRARILKEGVPSSDESPAVSKPLVAESAPSSEPLPPIDATPIFASSSPSSAKLAPEAAAPTFRLGTPSSHNRPVTHDRPSSATRQPPAPYPTRGPINRPGYGREGVPQGHYSREPSSRSPDTRPRPEFGAPRGPDTRPRPEFGTRGPDTRPRPEFAARPEMRPRPQGSEYGSRPSSEYRAPSQRPGEGAAPQADRPQPRFGPPSARPGMPPRPIRESFTDRQARTSKEQQERFQQTFTPSTDRPRLGPTGRHFRDLVPPAPAATDTPIRHADQDKAARAASHMQRRAGEKVLGGSTEEEQRNATVGQARPTFDRSKPSRAIKKPTERGRVDTTRIDEDAPWRKRRPQKKGRYAAEDTTVRPSVLHVRLPIFIKDLAQEMKLKASQLISKLFLQGIAVTLNDALDDELTVHLLGHEFGCDITIDRREDDRIRITSKSVSQEIKHTEESDQQIRPPVVAFMGHVDHGKTSLIDVIRSSNRVSGEAGAITQHIGAFSCHTDQGDLTILDTPGHEAFAAMRERGAMVTDVIVLVVAGDEGMKAQTDEAIKHARSVNATILVAINKCDKPAFNVEQVYRQLAERDLLPEAWGGKIITVNCSAVTKEGIVTLLEMVALQAEVLELRANPNSRARGNVIEAELHKGLGNVATVLVQNGTLRHGDALVFNQSWGRVKTMRDEFNHNVKEAKPSQAVRITGLSSLPEAGEDFIVVATEKEARDIAEVRANQIREKYVAQSRKKFTMEALLQHSQQSGKKVLHCILRADVQGSVEALRFELKKIHSDKVEVNIVNEGIGEISESDVQLAAASGSVIVGFHTRIEAHAESLIKQHKVKVRCYDVIYHAVDGIRELMAEQLDKIAEEHARGKAEVRTIFRSSLLGKIAGCQVTEGTIMRSYRMRVNRGGQIIWDGPIASLRRGKDDVRELTKGFECGILLQGFKDCEEGDLLESYEIVYRTQSL